MSRLRPGLLATVLALAALPAAAATLVINNGLAPPNPANVINAANSYPSDRLIVTNVGCGIAQGCPSPGVPTSVLVESGIVGLGLGVRETSSISMTGGSIPLFGPDGVSISSLAAVGHATISVSGGAVGHLVTAENAEGTVLGGSIDFVESAGGTIVIHGGEIVAVQVYFGGIVRIFGANFSVDGIPVGLGAVEPDFGSLTGVLRSGELLDISFNRRAFGEHPGSGFLILVPEPKTALLLAWGLVGLAAMQRWGRAAFSSSSTP